MLSDVKYLFYLALKYYEDFGELNNKYVEKNYTRMDPSDDTWEYLVHRYRVLTTISEYMTHGFTFEKIGNRQA